MALEFTLNGNQVRIDDADPQQTLLQWLREQGFLGTKEGCAEGECGACAVAVLERDGDGRGALRAINSCLTPLAAVAGCSVISIEGVAGPGDELHPVQRALCDSGGSQCGYCTPGFAISLFCEYYRRGRSGYDPEAISGNLCRCTGYRPIIEAAKQLPQPASDDPRIGLLTEAPAERAALQHSAQGCQYFRPVELEQALAFSEQHPSATFIAGGTDLMVYANLRGRRFPVLIALDAIPELRALHASADEVCIGAALPLSQIEPLLAEHPDLANSLLGQLWPLFSSRLIRHRATLGGNLATASPIGDAAPVLLALDASLTLASRRGRRRVALHDFFVDYRRTQLQPGELIVSVDVPRAQPTLQRFYKVSKRKLDDISTVAAAFALQLDAAGVVQQLRIAYGGIAATPLRAFAAERHAQGKPWTHATLLELRAELEPFGTPQSDLRGSAAYRRALIGNLLEKFFAETAHRAQANP